MEEEEAREGKNKVKRRRDENDVVLLLIIIMYTVSGALSFFITSRTKAQTVTFFCQLTRR